MPQLPVDIEKISYERLIETSAHFLIMPELEAVMNKRVQGILEQLMDFSSDDDKVGNLRNFLQQEDDFLGVMLSMTGLPQEKFLRILSAERFTQGDYKNEWGIKKVLKKIKTDDDFANKIARLLLEGKNNELLAKKVAGFYLEQLSLSDNWMSSLQDKTYIARVIRKKLAGEYYDLKGKHFEKMINDTLDGAGISYEKGQVEFVQKEVDHAIPGIADARVLIMSAYHETTSSSQTERANEQRSMYGKIRDFNERYPSRPPVRFINIVDGGGWLARRSDLKKLHSSCDYCLNASMLPQLPATVNRCMKGNVL